MFTTISTSNPNFCYIKSILTFYQYIYTALFYSRIGKEMEEKYLTQDNSSSFNLTRFIVLETSVAIFTLLTSYIVVALTAYEIRQPGHNILNLHHPMRMKRSSRYALIMRAKSLAAAVFVLSRFACENYELIAQYAGVDRDHDYCNVVMKIKIVLTAIAMWFIYAFLWTRQRFCYAEPAMKHLSTKMTRAWSWISLLMLTVAQLVGTILFLVTRFYTISHNGCIICQNTIPESIPWIFMGTTTVIFQFILFALFVYPLLKHTQNLNSSLRPRLQSFAPMIRRVALAAAICSVTDLIALLLILLAKDPNEIIPTLAYDTSLMINMVCVVVSFGDWRVRVTTPFFFLPNDTSIHAFQHNENVPKPADYEGKHNQSYTGNIELEAPPIPLQNNYLTLQSMTEMESPT